MELIHDLLTCCTEENCSFYLPMIHICVLSSLPAASRFLRLRLLHFLSGPPPGSVLRTSLEKHEGGKHNVDVSNRHLYQPISISLELFCFHSLKKTHTHTHHAS